MRKWKAPQDQTLNYLNEQVELLQHRNQIAERIAAALEKMERKSP